MRVGVAGWSISAAVADRFPADGSHLERYAARFDAVEINSSFYRPHRQSTYRRWAESVPPDFRFAVKLPKVITHVCRLADCRELLARFADEIGGLGGKRGPILMQLPPSLAFSPTEAMPFLDQLHDIVGGTIVCEPRHPSWFTAAVDALLVDRRIARVAADPAPVAAAGEPGGWNGLRYRRLHGTPRIYWSAYDDAAIADHAGVARAVAESWIIYDNTAAGAAPDNALALLDRLSR